MDFHPNEQRLINTTSSISNDRRDKLLGVYSKSSKFSAADVEDQNEALGVIIVSNAS